MCVYDVAVCVVDVCARRFWRGWGSVLGEGRGLMRGKHANKLKNIKMKVFSMTDVIENVKSDNVCVCDCTNGW